MKYCCSHCRFKADRADFFRRERGGLFSLHQTVCEACSPYQPTIDVVRAALGLPILPVLIGFNALIHWSDESNSSLIMLIIVVTAQLTIPIRTFLHEAGHAFVARLMGGTVWEARIGRGPVKSVIRWGGVDFDIRRYGFAGGAVRYVSLTGRLSRLQNAVIIAAGPLANFLSAALAIVTIIPVAFIMRSMVLPSAILGGFALSHLYCGVVNLIPTKDSDGHSSDGRALWYLARRDYANIPLLDIARRVSALSYLKRYNEAAALAAHNLAPSPFKPIFAVALLDNLALGQGDGAALDYFFAHRADLYCGDNPSPDDIAHRDYVVGNVAWSALKLADKNLLELAGSYSAEAFRTNPKSPGILATRGAWFVSSGLANQGIPLLTKAARAIERTNDKADICRFLASGYRQAGDDARYALYTELAQHLDAWKYNQ